VTVPALLDLPCDTGTIVLVVLIVVSTTALSAVAGFGLGTVAVPLLLFILPPKATVAIIKVLSTGTGWVVLLSIWRQTRWRTLARIMPTVFAGLVVGGWILKEADPALIRLIVGLLVLISAVSLIARPLLIERDALWATSLVGFLTGVMGNATGLLAPAVVVYFTGRQFPRDAFRATTIALFLTADLVGLPTLLVQGTLGWSELRFALLMVPFGIAGRLIGVWLAPLVSQRLFRRLVIGMLAVMAVTTIVTATGELAR
jgi:uncharacterized membrane protein YfcA